MTFEPHSEQPPAVSDSGPDAPCPHTVTAAARASFLRRTFHSPIQRRRAACALYGLADDREFFALVEHLKASAKAAFSEHWSPRRAKLNKGLFDLLQALLKHADFAFGARVAFDASAVQAVVDGELRNVTYLIGKLATLPDQVRVIRVRKGEPDWLGRRSRRSHNEFELGPALRSVAAMVLGQPLLRWAPGLQCTLGDDSNCRGLPADGGTCTSVATVAANTRNGDSEVPATVATDLVLSPPDRQISNARTCEATEPRSLDRRNLTDALPGRSIPPTQPATEVLTPPTINTTRLLPEATRSEAPPPPPVPSGECASPSPPSAIQARMQPTSDATNSLQQPPPPPKAPGASNPRPEQSPAPEQALQPRPVRKARARSTSDDCQHELRHPLALIDSLVRMLMELSEHVRVLPFERRLVDGALSHVTSCADTSAVFAVFGRVRGMALQDHELSRSLRKTHRERPTLAYILGGPGPEHDPKNPNKFFLERLSRLREQDEAVLKRQHADDDQALAAAFFGTSPPEPPAPRRRRPERPPAAPRLRPPARQSAAPPDAVERPSWQVIEAFRLRLKAGLHPCDKGTLAQAG